MDASTTDTARQVSSIAVALGAVLAGCQPDLGAPPSLVSEPRLLAISATPAEAAPGSMVSYKVLVVDSDLATFPTGEPPSAPVDWAYCNDEKPLSDLTDISPECFTYQASFLVEIGQGLTASGELPSQGCSLFGPNVPPAMKGMPSGRPTDPDPTGGYYQPLRLILPTSGTPLLGAEESRILCGIAGASGAVTTQFNMEYKPNTNPVLAAVGASQEGSAAVTPLSPDDGKSAGFPVNAGERVVLSASWPACQGSSTEACGAETFPYYDPSSQSLTTQREALTVAWYTTAGSYDADTSQIASDDQATSAQNGWTAPVASGPALLWVVLLDDRGGAAWQRYRLNVM